VVTPELIFERWQPGEAHRIGPVRVDLLEVVADVEHREAVDLEARLRVGLGLRARAGRIPGARLGVLRACAREAAEGQEGRQKADQTGTPAWLLKSHVVSSSYQ
jgi:hypothetical protein